jgi:hypothetical protein
MTSEPKRHHYVPRFLLKRFAENPDAKKTVQLPLPLFGDSVVVRGVYYAAPVVGATTAAPAHCARGAWVSGDPSAVP